MYKNMMVLMALLLLTACQNSSEDKKVELKLPVKVESKKPFSKAFYSCEKERGETTVGVSSCFEEELKKQDEKLNKSYKKAKESIQPFRVEALRDVQRKWIAYRDSKCRFFNHQESGSSGALDEQSCLIKETITRTKELENIF